MTFHTEKWIEVPGGRVRIRIAGDGPGIPLIVLHGGPGSTHDYLRNLAALGDERPVVLYDQLGSGDSRAPRRPLALADRALRARAGGDRRGARLPQRPRAGPLLGDHARPRLVPGRG